MVGQALVAFKEQLSADFQAEFATLIDRLRLNTRNARLFGSSESLRNERPQIIYRLNVICLNVVRESFTSLNDRNGRGL